MKKITFTIKAVFLASILFQNLYASDAGVFQTYIVFDTGSGNDFLAGSLNPDLANTFSARDFGTLTQSSTLVLKGGEAKTFKNRDGDVFGGEMFYRVYRDGATPGSYNEVSLFFNADLGNGGDQRWQNIALNVNLLDGIENSGNYTIEVYWRIRTNKGDKFDNNSGNNTINTISFNYSVEPSLNISGTASTNAWRMLSSPVQNTTYSSFLNGLWTQGFTGASDGGANTSASSVRVWTTGGAFSSIGNITNEIPAGQGFLAVIYEDDDFETAGVQGGFPKTVSLTGSEHASGSATVHSEWALAGNPFAVSIAHANMDFTNFNNVVYVYDHTYTGPFSSGSDVGAGDAAGGFRTWNGTTGSLTDGKIAPFQGFWVQATSGETFNIAASAKSTGGTFYKETTSPITVQLAVKSGNTIGESWLSFNDNASVQRDRFDALSLKPLDLKPHLIVAMLLDDGTPLNINNLPSEIEGVIEVPLSVERFGVTGGAWVSEGGPAQMVWNTSESLPTNWDILLVDNHTGSSINLRDQNTYDFELHASASKVSIIQPEIAPQLANVNGDSRFTLKISDASTTNAPFMSDSPSAISLSQNYPNPFNPSTSVQFALPEAGFVSLAVYDVTGRLIASIANGEFGVGEHTVSFDASALSSGVYVYRLNAGGQTLTRKMTLMK